MIKDKNVVSYIGLNQKWSSTKVKATNDYIVLNRKLFTSFGKKFYCINSGILFPDVDIHREIKYPITTFFENYF